MLQSRTAPAGSHLLSSLLLLLLLVPVAAPVTVAGQREEWRSLLGFVGEGADAALAVASAVAENATVKASKISPAAVQGGGPTGWELFETAPMNEDGRVLWSDNTRTSTQMIWCPPLMAESDGDDSARCVFQGDEETALETVGGRVVLVEAAWFVEEREGSTAAEMAGFPLFNCTLGGALRLLEDSDVVVSVVLLTPARAEAAPYPKPEGDFSWKVPHVIGEASRAVLEELPSQAVKTTSLVAGQEALRAVLNQVPGVEVLVVERASSGRSTMEAFGPFSTLGISMTLVGALLNGLATLFLGYKLGAFIYALGLRDSVSLTTLCILLAFLSRLGSLIRCIDPIGVWDVVDGWFWPFFITWPFTLSVLGTIILSIIWHRQLKHALEVSGSYESHGCCTTSSGRQVTLFEIIAWAFVVVIGVGEAISTITSTVNRTTSILTSVLTAVPPLVACAFLVIAGHRVLKAAGATRRWTRMGGLITFIATTTAIFIPLLLMIFLFNLDGFSANNQRGVWIDVFTAFYLQTLQSFAVGASFTTPTRAGYERHRKFVAQLAAYESTERSRDDRSQSSTASEVNRLSRTTERLLQYAIDMSAFDTFDDLADDDLFDSEFSGSGAGGSRRRQRSGGDHSLE